MFYSCIFTILTIFVFYFLGTFFNYIFKIKNYICRQNIVIISIGSLIYGNITLIILSFSALDFIFLEFLVIFFGVIGLILFFIKNKKINLRSYRFTNYKILDYLLLLFIFLFLFINLFQLFAPITNDDTLSYHFQIPKDYILNNGLTYSPFIPYNSPHLLEVIHVIPLMMGGELSLKILLYIISILLCLKIFTVCKYYFDTRTGLIATLLVISTPKFTYINSSGIVEIYLALITLSAIWIYCEIINTIKQKNNSENQTFYDLVIYGSVFLGGVASIKYYGLFTVFSLSIAVLYFIIKYNFKNYKRLIILSLIFGSLFLLPFYIKNVVFTGNPLYPKFFSIFGGSDWSQNLSILTENFFSEHKRMPFTFLNFILSPFYLFLDQNTVSGRFGYGILILLLLPVLIYKYFFTNSRLLYNNFNIQLIIYYIISIWILWFLFSFHRDRHLIVIIILLSILIANSITFIIRNNKDLNTKLIILFIFIVGMMPNVFANIYFNQKYLELFFLNNSDSKFIQKYLPLKDEFQNVNQTLEADSKIINLIGNRQYFLDFEQFYPSPAFQGRFDFSSLKNNGDLYKLIKKDGFTHIISLFEPDKFIDMHYDKIDSNNFLNNYNKLFNNLIMQNGTKIYESKNIKIRRSRTVDLGSYERKFYLYKIN